jgi:hypothetical protein
VVAVLLGLLKRLGVSVIMAGPFILAGVYGAQDPEFPRWASAVVLLVGLALGSAGFYMSITGIVPAPNLVAGERILVTRHPTMKPAFARMMMSIPFFLVAAYLFELTEVPYVFPFVFFLVGLYLFFKGAMRYLRNLHITYTVTDRRVVHLYRFLWLHTKEIPAARIISISEARNFFEIITGRGSVVVSSGIGERQTIRMDDISDPGPIAESIRGFFS